MKWSEVEVGKGGMGPLTITLRTSGMLPFICISSGQLEMATKTGAGLYLVWRKELSMKVEIICGKYECATVDTCATYIETIARVRDNVMRL